MPNKQKRCKKHTFNGWESSDRCLLDEGHSEDHNFLNPTNEVQQKRFEDNSNE